MKQNQYKVPEEKQSTQIQSKLNYLGINFPVSFTHLNIPLLVAMIFIQLFNVLNAMDLRKSWSISCKKEQ